MDFWDKPVVIICTVLIVVVGLFMAIMGIDRWHSAKMAKAGFYYVPDVPGHWVPKSNCPAGKKEART